MARVKTDKELEQEKAEKAAAEAVPTKEPEVATQETGEAAETKVETDTTKETAQEEIPTWIDKILKSFKDLDELYITKNGGVFTKGTPKSLVESATLYKNPYYKK